MYLKLLTGRYKGNIREASPAVARAMLGDGRAERAYPQVDGPVTASAEPVQAPQTESPAPAAQISASQPSAPSPSPAARRRRRR